MSSSVTVSQPRVLPIAFGVFDLFVAALVAFGIFVGLPARYWLVDVGAVLVVAVQLGAGVGLLGKFGWADRFARWASRATLAIGLLLVAALAISASYLWGIYGGAGRGGSIILVMVVALIVPYLILLPLAELYWLSLRVATAVPAASPVTPADESPAKEP